MDFSLDAFEARLGKHDMWHCSCPVIFHWIFCIHILNYVWNAIYDPICVDSFLPNEDVLRWLWGFHESTWTGPLKLFIAPCWEVISVGKWKCSKAQAQSFADQSNNNINILHTPEAKITCTFKEIVFFKNSEIQVPFQLAKMRKVKLSRPMCRQFCKKSVFWQRDKLSAKVHNVVLSKIPLTRSLFNGRMRPCGNAF